MDWTPKEVELIVKDYFTMLQMELKHMKYNKTDHRSKLLPKLNRRSEGSIEFKHYNISAVLINMGLPFIKGYKPRYNYQKLLEQEILKYLRENDLKLEKDFRQFSKEIPTWNEIAEVDFNKVVDLEPPETSAVKERKSRYRPIKINYLEKEQNNRELGVQGENLVLEYEKWRLIKEGKVGLAEKVEWISKDHGDGTGYDILSKNTNGTDRYIEVKTTKLSKETPIYLTLTEVNFASDNARNFYLYRVFNFDSNPQFFIKQGDYETYCRLQPITFRGHF